MEFIKDGMVRNDTYSSDILNQYQTHRAGVNFMYQKDKFRAQVGASVIPTITHNETNGKRYDNTVVNWSPSTMLWYDTNDNTNVRDSTSEIHPSRRLHSSCRSRTIPIRSMFLSVILT